MPRTEQRARTQAEQDGHSARNAEAGQATHKPTALGGECDGWEQRTHNACRLSDCLARYSKVHGKGVGVRASATRP